MHAIDTVFERDDQDRPTFRTTNVTLPCGVIGYVGAPMVLKGRYHPDQAWLPFMQGTVLAKPPQDFYDDDTPARPFKGMRSIVLRKLGEPARIPHGWDRMYVYEDDQHVLPFDEYKEVEDEYRARKSMLLWEQKGPIMRTRLRGSGPPEPHPNVHSYYIHTKMSRDDIVEWAKTNLRGRFVYNCGTMQFQYASDAVFTKLKFEPVKPGRED